MEMIINFLDYIRINIEGNFIFTFIFFFIFLLIYNSFSIPGNMFFIAATGYFFGTYIGYFLSIFTLVFGSLIFFSYSHIIIQKIFPKIIGTYVSNIEKYIANSSIEYLIIFRMIPGPPLFLQNMILSFLKISKKTFILTTFLGFTPFVFMVVFIGNQLNDIDNLKNLSTSDVFSFKFLIFISFLIFIFFIRILYKRS